MNSQILASLSFAGLLIALSSAATLPPDAPPADGAALLKSLQDLRQKQEDASTSQNARLIEQVASAAASPGAAMEFYSQAVAATQFQGLSQENGQFREWKKREEARLKDAGFQESVRLHLFYLSLSLRRAAGAKVSDLVPQVYAYVRLLETSEEARATRESMLKTPVDGSVFAKWLRLGPLLGKAEKWEMNPGDGNEIARKILLPYWREQKSPELLAYWDARISRESARTSEAKLSFNQNDFLQVRKPALLWQRAQEYLALDQRNRAINEMYALIKANPSHPELATWIGTLEQLLTEPGH